MSIFLSSCQVFWEWPGPEPLRWVHIDNLPLSVVEYRRKDNHPSLFSSVQGRHTSLAVLLNQHAIGYTQTINIHCFDFREERVGRRAGRRQTVAPPTPVIALQLSGPGNTYKNLGMGF